MRGMSWEEETLRTDKGSPRYLMGNVAMGQESAALMETISESKQWMGVAEHLAKFVRRPMAIPKTRRSSQMTCSSAGSGWQNTTMSSAKREMLEVACHRVIRLRAPLRITCWSMVFSMSMMITKSMGDSGST